MKPSDNRPDNRPGRRGFLTGMLSGLGVSALALTARAKTPAKAAEPEVEPSRGPILYRRTAETERYYKTLYT